MHHSKRKAKKVLTCPLTAKPENLKFKSSPLEQGSVFPSIFKSICFGSITTEKDQILKGSFK